VDPKPIFEEIIIKLLLLVIIALFSNLDKVNLLLVLLVNKIPLLLIFKLLDKLELLFNPIEILEL
jgi:hypothetical protein